MKLTAICIMLLFVSATNAQDYDEYYQGINKAKLALIDDSLKQSMDHYFTTFEKFEFVFARDCFNALEVAALVGDHGKVDYFLRRCLKQGIHFEFLEQLTNLTEFKNTDAWSEILSTKDSLREIYESHVNWEIRKEVIAMFAEDQAIRDLTHKHRLNIFKVKKLNKEFEETDKRLVLRLLEITEEYGFPGEKLIGLDSDSMHPKIINHHLTAGMPIVIFIHHFSQPNQSYNDKLFAEVKNGHLFNEHYATISDFQYTYGKGGYRDSFCHSLMFTPSLNVKIIDENRRRINLLTLSKASELKRKKLITPKYYLY